MLDTNKEGVKLVMPFQSGRYYIIARFLSVPVSMIIFILYKKYHEVFFFVTILFLD